MKHLATPFLVSSLLFLTFMADAAVIRPGERYELQAPTVATSFTTAYFYNGFQITMQAVEGATGTPGTDFQGTVANLGVRSGFGQMGVFSAGDTGNGFNQQQSSQFNVAGEALIFDFEFTGLSGGTFQGAILEQFTTSANASDSISWWLVDGQWDLSGADPGTAGILASGTAFGPAGAAVSITANSHTTLDGARLVVQTNTTGQNFRFSNLVFDVRVLPEPSVLGLVGMGIGLIRYGRKRK